MKKQQKNINHSVALLTLLLATSTTTMARSTPVTVQNDASNPVPVTVQNPGNGSNARQLTGVTTQRKAMSEGIFQLNNACNAEFSGSRMCTTVEMLDTSGDFDFSTAWVRPVLKPVSLFLEALSPPRPVQFDAGSGFFNVNRQTSLNCEGFTPFGGVGIFVTDEGRFSKGSCTSELPVACCAAVPNQ